MYLAHRKTTDRTRELGLLEHLLLRELDCASPPIREVCEYSAGGGRRMRAKLFLSACTNPDDSAVRFAIALELLHAATLLQDDIFDRSQVRRGVPCAHLRFGQTSTLLASDWLLVRALRAAADAGPECFRMLSKSAEVLIEGECRECAPTVEFAQAERYWLCTARQKTGELFGTLLASAGVLNGESQAAIPRMHTLGVDMGVTYQAIDDVIDLYLTEQQARKSVGIDLTSGCLTMPVRLALEDMTQGERVALYSALVHRTLSGEQQQALRQRATCRAVALRVQRWILERVLLHAAEARHLHLDAFAATWSAMLEPILAQCFGGYGSAGAPSLALNCA